MNLNRKYFKNINMHNGTKKYNLHWEPVWLSEINVLKHSFKHYICINEYKRIEI